MEGMDDAQAVFVAKVDAFAATLEPEEQAMLVDLLVGDDEVAGFGSKAGWPGLATLGFIDVGQGDGVAGNGIGGNPDGVFVPGRTYTGFQSSGGGSPKG